MCASTSTPQQVRQRADLTFKYNLTEARHGWLRLTPAYSVKIVEQLLDEYLKSVSVLDPFSGTATTPLCAAFHGHASISVDINPFLVWFGNAKVATYDHCTISQTKELIPRIAQLVQSKAVSPAPAPPIANISRWWSKESLEYLCLTKAAVDSFQPISHQIANLLKIIFCKTLIEVSNVAFNHQSMSFKDASSLDKQRTFWNKDFLTDPFSKNAQSVLRTAELNPSGSACVMLGDARSLKCLTDKRFDLLLTSPPYPNRMSYIRELRPYMYWLGYLQEAREAGELDWQAIGGTWGIATSRLNDWKPNDRCYCPKSLETVIKSLAKSDTKSGPLMATYVAKYFEDMWLHFNAVRKHMAKNGKVHYIIGNSKFYDSLLPAEEIYMDMLEKAGFNNAKTTIIRKRNSKKELFEFDVSATA